MAVTYTIDGTLLLLEMAGVYVSADVIRQFLSAINDPACPARVDLIVDVTRSESLATRPADEIRAVSEFLGSYAERIGGRCAVVALPGAQYGLSAMGTVYSEGVGVMAAVFGTRAEAIEWLRAPSALRDR